MEVNQFADMTDAEYAEFLGYRQDLQKEREEEVFAEPRPRASLPAEVDWVTKGYVTPIKNQVIFFWSCVGLYRTFK